MIRLEHVSKQYDAGKNRIRAVDDVTLRVEPGAFAMILGHSGCGKTTLLNLIAGLTRPNSGEILLLGRNIQALKDAELSRLRAIHIGFIFQFQSMLTTLDTLDNVMLPDLFGRQSQDRRAAFEMLARVGLGERTEAYAHELSLGQQRRVGVARALAHRPQLLLCDEPTGDLDAQTEQGIMEIIAQAHQQGATIVMATHNQDLCHYATRIIRIDNGRLIS